MVDVILMQALMKAVPDNAALLIVGDIGRAIRDSRHGLMKPPGRCKVVTITRRVEQT